MTRLSTVFAAVVALVVVPPAHGTASSTASVTELAITLFDLNPADGITPAITFPTSGPFTSFENQASVAAYDTAGIPVARVERSTGPLDLNAATSVSSAHAAISGGTSPDTVSSITASGSASGPALYLAAADGPDVSGFRITANTLVSFLGLVHLEAVISDSSTRSQPASAGVFFGTTGPGAEDSGFPNSYQRSVGVNTAGSESLNDRITISFVNRTAGEMDGVFNRSVSVLGEGGSPVPVIPEPETYAAMLVGLAIAAVVIRRRTRRE